jgi:hypothetical protein
MVIATLVLSETRSRMPGGGVLAAFEPYGSGVLVRCVLRPYLL